MTNNRIFWACQAVLIIERNSKPISDDILNATYLDGVQAVGVQSDMPSTTVGDIGRFQQKFRYENRQKIFTINISRVLNKLSNPFYKTASYVNNYATTHLLNENNLGVQGEYNTNSKCLKNYDVFLVYGDDTISNIGDSSSYKYTCYRGCLISSLSYNISVDGLVTEDITLTSKHVEYSTTLSLPSVPSAANIQSGNILKKENIAFTLPEEAEELFGTDDSLSVDGQAVYGIQSINLEMSIDYTNLNDIGIWRGYDNIEDLNLWDFISTPVSITATINGIARSIYPNKNLGSSDREFNPNKTIKVTGNTGSDYFIWDLGTKNFMQNFSVNGGDTAGGNAEVSVTYTNEYSDFIVAKGGTVHSITNNGPY
jgi:hypothetical protein